MNDITKKLLTEYRKRIERQREMAAENMDYCRDNFRKYGGTWLDDTNKWEGRLVSHIRKLAEIDGVLQEKEIDEIS